MDSIEQSSTKIVLDQIEREIQQIDQIVNSWSNGRTLRYDPAHVRKSGAEQPSDTSRAVASAEGVRGQVRSSKWLRMASLVNLLVVFLASGILVVQAVIGNSLLEISPGLMFGCLIAVGGVNLFLVTRGAALELPVASPDSMQEKTGDRVNGLVSRRH